MNDSVAPSQFVHLNIHSDYSLVDSIVQVDSLCDLAVQMNMPALALTDVTNLYAAVKFFSACWKRGIKPIIGADLWVSAGPDTEPSRLLMLCQNQAGYLNLMELISEAYLHGQRDEKAIIQMSWLTDRTEGLIAISGWRRGDIHRALVMGKNDEAATYLAQWQTLFPDRFYLELQRLGLADEAVLIARTVTFAGKYEVPVVATNAVRFLCAEDDEAHETRVCIQDKTALDDPTRERKYFPEQYFKSQEAMVKAFDDIPSAIANTLEIAKRCNLEIKMGKDYLPDFPVPKGMTVDDFFEHESYEGLNERFQVILSQTDPEYDAKKSRYTERLQTEIDVIKQMGFPGYFLIVADFIRWARENDIPVGPGRGSGAGSLVAYVLKITDINPLAYDLLFERFLNPERVSMPDFDVDFCTLGRDRVIAYVAEKYGRHAVSQIATHGTMAAKMAVRDVGRALGMPYGQVDQIARLIPLELKITIAKSLQDEPELKSRYEGDEDIATLINLAMKLEGTVRNVGKHAGGVVIAPTKLTDFSPLYCESDGNSVITQYDKKDVEEVGLVKFDFLGLSNLTIIDMAVKAINKQRQAKKESPLDISLIPLNDSAVYDLLKHANTTAVFQLESRGMKDLIRRLRPDNFEDVIALVALFRPGPLGSGMVDDFIARKHGEAAVVYPHPALEGVLSPTYGVILYQEQVMQVAQILANYSLGGADLLRRAMGKKDKEEMQHQRALFIEGAEKNNVAPKLAGEIFDLLEHFADYGFNKSHSAAYAMLAYQTAWLKTHYTAWFMAAVLSSDMDKTEKVVIFIEDCRHLKIKILPPDVNRSNYLFKAVSEQAVLYGLGAIKGVGEGAIASMVAERDANGPFTGLYDFCSRLDMTKFNRRALEALIKAGAMEGFDSDRACLFAQLDDAIAQAEQLSRNKLSGQVDLFGFSSPSEEAVTVSATHATVCYEKWSESKRLAYEKEALGLYLSGHPFEAYAHELVPLLSHRLIDLAEADNSPGAFRNSTTLRIAGLVLDVRILQSEYGRRAIVMLDDRTAQYEVSLTGETLEREMARLIKDRVLIVDGSIKYNPFRERNRLTVDRVYQLEHLRMSHGRRLTLVVSQPPDIEWINSLEKCLAPYVKGRSQIWIEYHGVTAEAKLTLGEAWRVKPYDELLDQLGKFGEVRVSYKNE